MSSIPQINAGIFKQSEKGTNSAEKGAGQNNRFQMKQNRQFQKRDKIADFKAGQNSRFCKREQTAIKIVSLTRRLGLIIDN